MTQLPEPKSPLAYLYQREHEVPDRVYLRQPVNRQVREFSWGEVADQARRMATALAALGVSPGDRVAIFSKNCAEWIIADLAIMMSRAVSVPIYATANASTIGHILEHSGAGTVIIGKLDDWKPQEAGIPEGTVRIAMPYDTMPCEHHWNDLLEQHAPLEDDPLPELDSLMTLLYTSGSTGTPKGAMHDYRNFVFAGQRIGAALQAREDERILSYLPLAHCTERAYVEASTLVNGGIVSFVESLETFTDDLRELSPTMFGSVPRLWKRFQLGVLDKIPEQKLERLQKIPIVRGIVARKIRRQMGLGDCRWFMSGSAPIAPSLLEWWARLDMPIAEGWGMTETLAYGAMLPYGHEIRTGSIGKVALDTDIRVSEVGEIEIRTGSLMEGYYKDEDQTADCLTGDGYLKTGDRGRIDEDGYIFITGRVKDIFKTAKGKYVAPIPIESKIARNELVEQACLIGSGLKQPVALIEPSDALHAMAHEEIIQSLEATRQAVNAELESHERIDCFIVVDGHWTVEEGLLTPTLKIKRHELEAKYHDLVRAKHAGAVVFEDGDE